MSSCSTTPAPIPEIVSERVQVVFTVNGTTSVHGVFHSREIAMWEAFRLTQKIPGVEIKFQTVSTSVTECPRDPARIERRDGAEVEVLGAYDTHDQAAFEAFKYEQAHPDVELDIVFYRSVGPAGWDRMTGRKPTVDKALFDMGHKDGAEWAIGHQFGNDGATREELDRLAEYARNLTQGGFSMEEVAVFMPENNDAYSASEQFYFCIQPDDEKDRGAAAEFWENLLDGINDNIDDDCDPSLIFDVQRPHNAYVCGFACGAGPAADRV